MMRTISPWLVRFFLREDGATAVEFALLSAFFISFMLALIDLGRIAWTLNVDEAATREGARYAIVQRGPLNGDFSWTVAGNTLADGNGQSAPTGAVPTQTCTSGTAVGCNQFDVIVAQMQRYDSRIQGNNVEIVYQHVGLGVIGNPCSDDIEPLVTVRLRNMAFHTGALQVFGLGTLTLPAMSATLVGENWRTQPCGRQA